MEFRKMVMITLYAKQKKRHRTDFWTLWEKARVGCFERTACILSRVKQITSPGGMHETSARTWCTGRPRGIGWRGRQEGGSGWGIHVTPWLIHVNVWQNPLKCCEVISLQLIKINEKKKRMPVLKCQQHCCDTESFCETVMILFTWGILNHLKSGSLNGTNHEKFSSGCACVKDSSFRSWSDRRNRTLHLFHGVHRRSSQMMLDGSGRIVSRGTFYLGAYRQGIRLPWWLSAKEPGCQCRRGRFSSWVGKIPQRRAWQPTPVYLPGKSHGQRSLVGCSPWDCKGVG